MSLETPIGILRLVAREGALIGVYFPGHTPAPAFGLKAQEDGKEPVLEQAAKQILEYLAGSRFDFDLPQSMLGTPFQREVWAALRTIPYGECVTYGELAKCIGKSQAIRALGAANARNPLSIIVPCHRVIGSDGSLVGYAGGLSRKRWLLDLESRVARAASMPSDPPSVFRLSAARSSAHAQAPSRAERGSDSQCTDVRRKRVNAALNSSRRLRSAK